MRDHGAEMRLADDCRTPDSSLRERQLMEELMATKWEYLREVKRLLVERWGTLTNAFKHLDCNGNGMAVIGSVVGTLYAKLWHECKKYCRKDITN